MHKRTWIAAAAVMMALLLMTAAIAATKGTAPKSKTPPKPAPLPRLLDLGSDSCIPCKMMAPVLDELKKEYKGKLTVSVVDVKKNPKAAEKYRVRMIPTQILFDKNGKEIARHQGFWAKQDILAEFKKHGVKLDPVAPPKKK